MTKCDVCGSPDIRRELVDKVFDVDGKLVQVEEVPASVCARCGERSFDVDTVTRVYEIVHGKAPSAHYRRVKVLQYA